MPVLIINNAKVRVQNGIDKSFRSEYFIVISLLVLFLVNQLEKSALLL